jgi:hypothetical protein
MSWDESREADGPLVELAVETGRVAIPVALATGRPVIASTRRRRCSSIDEPAALIYCPYRALLHVPTWADRRRTFDRVTASLRPSGRFAWNAFTFQQPVAHTVQYSVGDNRIDIHLDGGGTSSLWWATKNEWLGLIDVAGLELESLWSGFDREPFSDDGGEYVFVGAIVVGSPGSGVGPGSE